MSLCACVRTWAQGSGVEKVLAQLYPIIFNGIQYHQWWVNCISLHVFFINKNTLHMNIEAEKRP